MFSPEIVSLILFPPPTRCANHVVCRDYSGGSEVCDECAVKYGRKLITAMNIKCPVCHKTTLCVKLPGCYHMMCSTCFRHRYCAEQFAPPVPEYPDPPTEESLQERLEGIRARARAIVAQHNRLARCPWCTA